MPPEIAKKAIDFVIARSGVRHNIEVDFFGGEPLGGGYRYPWTVDYARSLEEKYNKKFATITTNGLLLDEDKRKYINENMDNCVLSLDGRREVNDEFRKTVAGTGSYDTIAQVQGAGGRARPEPRLLCTRHVHFAQPRLCRGRAEHCRCRFDLPVRRAGNGRPGLVDTT